MRHGLKTFRRRVGRLIVFTLMLGLCLGTLAVSVSPQLHHWLHHDSASTGHQCVVTLITRGHLLTGATEQVILTSAVVFRLLLLDPVWNFSAIDYRVSPSRAPPLISSSL